MTTETGVNNSPTLIKRDVTCDHFDIREERGHTTKFSEQGESWLTLSARDPDSGFYHEASDSFLAKNQTVNFLQIFQRQRGAKITVVLPDYTECLIYQ